MALPGRISKRRSEASSSARTLDQQHDRSSKVGPARRPDQQSEAGPAKRSRTSKAAGPETHRIQWVSLANEGREGDNTDRTHYKSYGHSDYENLTKVSHFVGFSGGGFVLVSEDKGNSREGQSRKPFFVPADFSSENEVEEQGMRFGHTIQHTQRTSQGMSREALQPPYSHGGGGFQAVLRQSLQRWEGVQQGVRRLESQLPPQYREFFQLQREVQEMGLQVHLWSSAAESLSQTVRKLQQLGAG